MVAGILEVRLEGISNFQKGKIRCKSQSNLIKMGFLDVILACRIFLFGCQD